MSILDNNFIFTPPTPTTEQLLDRADNTLRDYVRSSFNQAVAIQRAGNTLVWYNDSLSAQQIFDSLSANGEAAQLATYYESLSTFIRSVTTFESVSAELVEPAYGYFITLSSGTVTVVP